MAGKIENLRVALRRLDGVVVPAGGVFSFWQQIGRARRRKGYVEGRELRKGCIIPTLGGGLCQLSNALYAAAVDAEEAALARAQLIVTPHRDIAHRCATRAFVLPRAVPQAALQTRTMSEAILFAGGTLGRSGAYEMREAARRLGAPVILVGNTEAEGTDFWRGVDVTRVTDLREGWRLARIAALPAFVEHRPRLLLHALSAGAAVVASSACGLAPHDQLKIVAPGDVDGLCAALAATPA